MNKILNKQGNKQKNTQMTTNIILKYLQSGTDAKKIFVWS
jgi:hypothetical protein